MPAGRQAGKMINDKCKSTLKYKHHTCRITPSRHSIPFKLLVLRIGDIIYGEIEAMLILNLIGEL